MFRFPALDTFDLIDAEIMLFGIIAGLGAIWFFS